MKNESLTTRLIRRQSIVISIIVGGIMLLFFFLWKNQTMKENITQNKTFVEIASHQFQTLVDLTDERTNFIQDLYSKHSNTLDLEDWITNHLLDKKIFKGVHYVEINNNQLGASDWYSTDSFNQKNKKSIAPTLLTPSFQEWCLNVTQNDWGKWSEPFFLPFFDMKYGVLYSIPLYVDSDKKVLSGVLSIIIDLEWLRLQLDYIQGEKEGDIILLSHSGRYIAHPYNQYYQGRNLQYNFPGDISEDQKNDLIRRFLNIKASFSKRGIESGDEDFYYFWNTVPITSWKIVYKVPSDVIEMESWDVLWKIILALIIVLSVSIGLFFIIINYEVKPLRKLVEQRSLQQEGTIKNELTLLSDEIDELTKERNTISDELKKHSIETKSISEELRIARSVQQSILPHGKIIHPSITMAADLIPARKLGGDLYDYFMIDANRLCIAIGDVSGHGIGASLYMAIAQTIIHRQTEFGISSSAEIVERINNELCNEKNYELFLTLFFGILDLKTGWFDYCNSGHNFPYVLSPKSSKISRLEESHGIPIGIYPGKKYGSNRIRIDNEDMFFAYTDGVIEERNMNNQLFSVERLEEILHNTYHQGPEEIIFEIEDQLSKFRGVSEQDDDITLLAVKFLKKKVEVPVIGVN